MAQEARSIRIAEHSVSDGELSSRELELLKQKVSFADFGDDAIPIQHRAMHYRLRALYARVFEFEETERGRRDPCGAGAHTSSTLPSTAAKRGVLNTTTRRGGQDPSDSRMLRRLPRVATMATALLGHDGCVSRGVILNVGPQGAFIATATPLQPGATIAVTFTLLGLAPVTGEAMVRWVRSYQPRHPDLFPGVGIELLATASDARAILADFVREEAKSVGAPTSPKPT